MKHSAFKVRKVEGHKCTLPQEGDLVSLHIDEGICVGFRRKWRQVFLVDPKNPQSKSVLKSTALIRREEARQLRKYYYMIHPFSQAKATWELIMIVVLWGQFIIMPISLGTLLPIREVLRIQLICNFFSYVDVILTFFTGYVDVKSNRVVLDSRKILKKYLLTFFFADIISTFPYSLVIRLTEAYTFHTCRYLHFLRLVRLPTLVTFMRRFAIRMDIWNHKSSSILSGLWFIILLWWGIGGNVFQIVHEMDIEEALSKTLSEMAYFFLKEAYHLIRAATLVNIGNFSKNNFPAIISGILWLILGIVLSMVLLAKLAQYYSKNEGAKDHYHRFMHEVNEYMIVKNLPNSLKSKVQDYLKIKLKKNIMSETEILESLSERIQQDVLLHNYKSFLEGVAFLKHFPSHIRPLIISRLKTDIFLPNEVICEIDQAGTCMFFLNYGIAAVYGKSSKELMHFEDGASFGIESIVFGIKRIITVVAVTHCEVLKLNRKDLLEIIEPYPRLSNIIREFVIAFMHKTFDAHRDEVGEIPFHLKDFQL